MDHRSGRHPYRQRSGVRVGPAQAHALLITSRILSMPDLSVVDLVGVGLNATDTLIPLDEFPARGSKVEFAPVPLMPGGQTASAVAACQAWGLATRYVGKLGDDDAARLHRSEFARLGVDARLIEVANAASPQSVIIVDGGGERTVLIRRDDRLQLAD